MSYYLSIKIRFLSTPSVWRATILRHFLLRCIEISIHALRVEGDNSQVKIFRYVTISIHALRVEGDGRVDHQNELDFYFYPRPPWGGRRKVRSHPTRCL